VENARLATTFSNDNNYPGETSLPIRRERLLFFIYGQAHYFCASKHMKNSPLARSNPPFSLLPSFLLPPPPPDICPPRLPTRAARTSHGFIKLVATMRRLDFLSLSLSLFYLLLSHSCHVIFSSDRFACHSSIRRSVIGIIAGRLDTTILHRSFGGDTYRSGAWEHARVYTSYNMSCQIYIINQWRINVK